MTEEEYFNYLAKKVIMALVNADDFNKRELCILKLHILTNANNIFKNKENFEEVVKVLNKNLNNKRI